ncbi:integral membrane sensor signal transduction histidine kinase [Methylocella silvestris BL2]|uniref:histidine kinase n=1 Tax=Methylocella silvestris (strain DSM 15510 / CIP 108128 / LMG 27833 / NCIMB 13906 / BL2) TaxID=395965 RepID=B8EM48_METSB|nr:integral membrane sensor signal transduction histidine kinase [Methylocella silvestris BL2]
MSLSLSPSLERPRIWWRGFWRGVTKLLPQGLYARAALIVILPMIILQCVLTYVFMERHWQLVTNRLSTALTQDIAALIDLHQTFPGDDEKLMRIAQDRLNIDAELLPKGPLPPTLPKPFFSIVDAALSNEIRKQISRPFWLDTVGRSNLIEIRILLDDAILRVVAFRSAAYASNSYIFLLWMVGTSFVLIVVAGFFLRNQIKPILSLAGAAEEFGKGRDPEFRPRGAREVRRAGFAFIEMKRRIERAIEQRTTMLNGVSHDLRTVLTRFKLSLALMPDSEETQELQKDVAEMQRMLEAYLAFARGAAGERAVKIDMIEFLEELRFDAEREGRDVAIAYSGEPIVTLRPDAFKRCLSNLIGNAQNYAKHVAVEAVRDRRFLIIHVDDDGPGIPPAAREDVFRPFFRIDEARNQDVAGTGLGLAIALDIARSHGGDIQLSDSPMGGLRATVRVPL